MSIRKTFNIARVLSNPSINNRKNALYYRGLAEDTTSQEGNFQPSQNFVIRKREQIRQKNEYRSAKAGRFAGFAIFSLLAGCGVLYYYWPKIGHSNIQFLEELEKDLESIPASMPRRGGN